MNIFRRGVASGVKVVLHVLAVLRHEVSSNLDVGVCLYDLLHSGASAPNQTTKRLEARHTHFKAMVEFEYSFSALVSVFDDPLDEYVLAFSVGVFHRARCRSSEQWM